MAGDMALKQYAKDHKTRWEKAVSSDILKGLFLTLPVMWFGGLTTWAGLTIAKSVGGKVIQKTVGPQYAEWNRRKYEEYHTHRAEGASE